mmetsp:Transcript_6554/g.10715  ORF Transcript_6554/g.10715 Transcript_6554/m.10715 type:complete len:108 (+) Transcript_6554:198-521(+)
MYEDNAKEGVDDHDDDLYGDIETLARSAAEEQFKKRLHKSLQQNKALEAELKDHKEQIKLLTLEKAQVEQNMMCLYNTAVSEIARKDKQLAELRGGVLKAQSASRSK